MGTKDCAEALYKLLNGINEINPRHANEIARDYAILSLAFLKSTEDWDVVETFEEMRGLTYALATVEWQFPEPKTCPDCGLPKKEDDGAHAATA